MNDKKIILGFVGEIASGKDTAMLYLNDKYHAVQYKFSGMLRDILNRLHLEINRANMQKLSQILRENFTQDILSKVISYDVEQDKNDIIVINGIRRHSDVSYLNDLPNFYIVYITADMEKRYQRIIKRSENKDDAGKTFEQFKKDHEAEAELEIINISKDAKYTIDNNGDFESLYRQLDNLITTIKKN